MDKRRIRQRTPHVLRLPTRDRIRGRAIPEQFSLDAPTRLASDAVETLPAGRIERNDDLVADLELLDAVALLDNLTDELVAADEVGRAFEVAAVEVEVAATEGGASDFEDGVGGILKLGVGAVFYNDLEQLLVEAEDSDTVEGARTL